MTLPRRGQGALTPASLTAPRQRLVGDAQQLPKLARGIIGASQIATGTGGLGRSFVTAAGGRMGASRFPAVPAAR